MKSGARQGTSRLPALDSDEVRTATFNQSQLAWRGYCEDEVRAFLSRVADSMVAADQERAALRVEIDRLRNFYRDHGHDVDLTPNGTTRRQAGDPTGGSVMLRVQAYAEVQVERARQYAALVDSRSQQASDAFHQATTQSALAIEDTIQRCAVNAHGQVTVDPSELDRISVWVRAFFHALQAQLEVTNDFLSRAADQSAAPAQIPRR